MVTPWHEIPNGWCLDAGIASMIPGYVEAAYDYGRKYQVDIDTAYRIMSYVYDENSVGYEEYQNYLKNPTAYSEIDGIKKSITLANSDFNGDGILSEEEYKKAGSNHTY